MSIPNPHSLTFATPRIEYTTFLSRLKSKNSPAVPEAQQVWNLLVSAGVDPSFALAQYRVESQYGTAGHAKVSRSWGNMLWDASLCKNAVDKYSPGNGYTYAVYDTAVNAIKDYIHYLDDYANRRGFETIYEATAEWIGKAPGSSGHLSYVGIIINDMIDYEIPDGTFYETGDEMIYAGSAVDFLNGRVKQRYPLPAGTVLYRGTNGDELKKFQPADGKTANALFFGLVNGATDWGVVFVKTSSADPNGTLVYIKNIDKTKIINVT